MHRNSLFFPRNGAFGTLGALGIAAVLGALGNGCSGGSSAASGGSGGDLDASADATPANPCTNQDSHVVDDAGTCAASITWTAGPKIATPRNHHMTWVVDQGDGARFVYVAGGSDSASRAVADVQRAPINADGTLGAWQEQTALPAATIAASVIVTHGEVILTGGYGTQKTWVSRIGADGSMGAWTAAADLTGPYFHATGVAFGDFAYVMGGLDGQTEEDQVSRAPVAADGTVGTWTQIGKLPYVLSHHASLVNGSFVYVLGGETMDGVARADVLRAAIASDGSLGTWQTDTAMPIADETHAAFVHDGALYIAGGIGGPSDVSLAKIARAPLNADGTIGAWVVDADSALPHARSHVHQMPIYKNFIYSVAGAPTGFPSVTGDTAMGVFH